MDRRRFVTSLRDDDLRCQRKWALGVAVFYAIALGVLGSVVWLSAKPSGGDLGQPAMAGHIVAPQAAVSLASPWKETK
ncbi:MAG: hypothetical protein JOY64_11560 [Alphaproteobacteria bacterium]|nr:hypothetical protein [Alphaproteobacteria bacterium]